MERAKEIIVAGSGDKATVTGELQRLMEEAFAQDRAIYEELSGKIGEDKAGIISELANLAMFAITRTPPSAATVDSMAGGLLKVLALDEVMVSAYLKRFCEVRGLKVPSEA